MARIELIEVSKRWGSVDAVHPMSLDIADGEFLVLLGPSGCGKTTTMRMVAGLETPTAGEIRIGGRRVNELEPKDRDVAMVFQSYGLYPNMTVAENIAFPLKIRGRSAADIAQAVRRAAERVELTEYLQRRPKELSGGQRQRVALARAIVREPAVFLMDEPLSNLDAKLRSSMRAHLKHLHHELGVTTIYVTHDQIEALTLAHRVVVMSKARVQQVGSPEAIYNDPSNVFVAGFIGSPPMNLIEGRWTEGSFAAEGVRAALPHGGESSATVVLGIRPEELRLGTAQDATVGRGLIEGVVFSTELTGDATLITVRSGSTLVTAKAGRAERPVMGTAVSLYFDPHCAQLFDAASGARIRPTA